MEQRTQIEYLIRTKNLDGSWVPATLRFETYRPNEMADLDQDVRYLREGRGFEVRVVRRTTVITEEILED